VVQPRLGPSGDGAGCGLRAQRADDPFAAAKAGFAQAKAATAAQGGANAVVQAYHGGLVPPFCTAAARGFFQQVLASAH